MHFCQWPCNENLHLEIRWMLTMSCRLNARVSLRSKLYEDATDLSKVMTTIRFDLRQVADQQMDVVRILHSSIQCHHSHGLSILRSISPLAYRVLVIIYLTNSGSQLLTSSKSRKLTNLGYNACPMIILSYHHAKAMSSACSPDQVSACSKPSRSITLMTIT
jgi:hypothetical protein